MTYRSKTGHYVRFCVLLAAGRLFAQDFAPAFSLDTFSPADGRLHLAGAASFSTPALRLTPAEEERSGAAWFHGKQAVANGFETAFHFRLTAQGGIGKGADGFAFVLQNAGPNAVAGRGSSGGFALGDGYGNRDVPGIPLSIAVFFDTFKNDEIHDPSDNYIALCTNGRIGEMQWPPARLARSRKLKVRMKDGREHTARIVYRPPVLTVELDGAPALSAAVDVGFVADAAGESWVGFTASTGAGWENHDILSWSFAAGPKLDVSSSISYQSVPCLPDRNLCTPERAAVEETAPGKWHIILPAQLEWPVSVPTPEGRQAVVSNARGMVCWDLENSGTNGCGGPEAALATRVRDGRTWFSIKDPTGRYADNEGHFEFDVEVK